MSSILVKKGTYIVLLRGIGTVLAFILSVMLARSLGAEGYGSYSFALSVLMIISIPIQSGIPILAVREAAIAAVKNNDTQVALLWSWSNMLIFSYSLIVITSFCIMVLMDWQWTYTQRFYVILMGLLSVPFIALILMQSAIVRGLGHAIKGVICDGLFRPLINIFLFVILLLIVGADNVSTDQAVLVYTVSAAITLLLSYLVIKTSTKNHSVSNNANRVVISRWRASLSTLTIVGGAQLLFGYIDTLILGFFREDSEVGVYRVAVQFSVVVSFGLTVLNQLLHPYISKLYTNNDFDKLQKLIVSSSLAILGIAAIPALLLLIFGEYILDIIYGVEYVAAALALKVLVLGQLINAAIGSVGALLNMTGHEKDSMKGLLVAIAVNVLLDLILIPLYGIEGAAVASATSLAVWNIILKYYVMKRLEIESSSLLYYIKKLY
jgi:O-antigen/teichoic acid export membrane protein